MQAVPAADTTQSFHSLAEEALEAQVQAATQERDTARQQLARQALLTMHRAGCREADVNWRTQPACVRHA